MSVTGCTRPEMDLARVNEDLLTKEFVAVILAGYGDG